MSRPGLVARNVLATLATQLAAWALTFAVTLYLPRYLGDAGLGKLAFAAAFVTIFGVFVPFGTSTVLVKEIARDRSRTGDLLTAALALRVPLGLLMTALAIGAVNALGYPSLTRTLVVIAALGMIVGTINDALASALQGQENMPRQSVGTLVEKLLSSGLTIAFVLLRMPLWTIAAVGLFTGMVSLLVNLTAFRFWLATLRRPSPASLRALALAGLPFMGWTVFQTLYGQSDPVVLRFLTDDATVGWYAAAFRLVGTTLFLPMAITTALLPTLARLHQAGDDGFAALARRTLALVMFCGVPIAFVLVAMPDRLMALMHYPPQFVHSVPVLRVGGVGVLLWYAAAVLGTLVIARDEQARMFKVSVAASVMGLPLCCAGTWAAKHWLGNGAVGAMSSDVLLELFLIVSYLKILPSGVLGRDSVSLIGRYGAAALPMAAVFQWVTPRTHLGLLALVPCAAVYVLACGALRCLGPSDVTLLRGLFSRKLTPAEATA